MEYKKKSCNGLFPEDTRMIWQGASLDKEQRARMGKEMRNHEAKLLAGTASNIEIQRREFLQN